MSNVVVRAVETLKSGGLKQFSKRTGVFIQRRFYRAQARRHGMRYELQTLDIPERIISGTMYAGRIRLANRSKIAWNASNSKKPDFALAATFHGDNGVVIIGPHSPLPAGFTPGKSAEVRFVIDAPRIPGHYKLTVDVVRENCYWFEEIGQEPAQKMIEVAPHSTGLMQSLLPSVDITLDVTNKCPLKCIQCRKTYFETFDEQQDMNWPLFQKIAAEAFPYARSVCLSSAGEPLMTRNFIEAIELAGSYGVPDISFITAGLHLNPKRAEKIVELGVSRIEFSIDGATAETYNRIRIGSNFDKVVNNIRYLNEVKRKTGSSKPLLRFNFVLMKSNIHELPQYIDFAASMGASEVQTQHMVIFDSRVENEALIFDKAKSNAYLSEAIKRARHQGILFYHPPLFDIQTKSDVAADAVTDGRIWTQEDEYVFERKTHPVMNDGMQLCSDPWRKLYVDWQGFVFPCCVWKEEPLGDLRKDSFPVIWSSPRYASLRNSLISGKLGKSCATCSVITGGDVNRDASYFFGN